MAIFEFNDCYVLGEYETDQFREYLKSVSVEFISSRSYKQVKEAFDEMAIFKSIGESHRHSDYPVVIPKNTIFKLNNSHLDLIKLALAEPVKTKILANLGKCFPFDINEENQEKVLLIILIYLQITKMKKETV
jgi:hypothetical protein